MKRRTDVVAEYDVRKIRIRKDGDTYTLLPADVLEVDCGIISSEGSSFTKTVQNALINSHMIVTDYALGTSTAMPDDWDYTTADGSITISGPLFTSTTLKVYLSTKRT